MELMVRIGKLLGSELGQGKFMVIVRVSVKFGLGYRSTLTM